MSKEKNYFVYLMYTKKPKYFLNISFIYDTICFPIKDTVSL